MLVSFPHALQTLSDQLLPVMLGQARHQQECLEQRLPLLEKLLAFRAVSLLVWVVHPSHVVSVSLVQPSQGLLVFRVEFVSLQLAWKVQDMLVLLAPAVEKAR